MKRRNASLATAIILCVAGMIAYNTYSRRFRQSKSSKATSVNDENISENSGIPGSAEAKSEESPPLSAIIIVYATETGNCERIAEQLTFEYKDLPCYVRAISIEDYDLIEPDEGGSTLLIFIASTVGQGDPPRAALPFLKSLEAKKYKVGKCLVVGLGHSAFATYNKCARDLFTSLRENAGAEMLLNSPILIDCSDAHFEAKAIREIRSNDPEICALIDVAAGLMRQAKSHLEIVELIIEANVPKDQIQHPRAPGRAGRSSDKALFEAKSAKMKKIVSVSADGREFHLVNISKLGIPDVTVGNAVKIWTPIEASVVDFAFSVFGEHLRNSGINGQNSGPTSHRLIFPKAISFDCVFRYVIDWTTTPSTYLMTMIGNAWLVDRSQNEKWIEEVKSRRATLIEYLTHMKAVRQNDVDLPLILLPAFPRLSPRVYTIASGIERFGVQSFAFDLCITESCTRRDLNASGESGELALSEIHCGRVSGCLKALKNTDPPLNILITKGNSVCSLSHAQKGGVWCAAGSGVSMIRAFVDERRRMFQRIKRVPASAAHTSVYMSFRNLSEYQAVNGEDLFQFAIVNGLISEAYVTFTREPDVGVFRVTAFGLEALLSKFGRAKMYLGQVITHWRPNCYHWLVDGTDGHLIVCGHVGLMDNVAKAFDSNDVEKLLSSSRFIAEVW